MPRSTRCDCGDLLPIDATASQLAEHLLEHATCFESPTAAFESAKAAVNGVSDMVIVFGSVYTVGEIADLLSKAE